MNKLWLIELIKLPNIGIAEELPLFTAFALLKKYGNVNVVSDENGKVEYQCDIDEVISNGITEDIIMKLGQNGWGLDESNSKIIKKL